MLTFSAFFFLSFFFFLLLSLSQSPVQHVKCHSMFSYTCNKAKSSRMNMCYLIPKFIWGSCRKGSCKNVGKNEHFFLNCHIGQPITFNNILRNRDSISGQSINRIIHILILWARILIYKSLPSASDVMSLLPLLLTPATECAQCVLPTAERTVVHRCQ